MTKTTSPGTTSQGTAPDLAPEIDTSHSNFVVLGHARCGSNLLLRALSDHPQIRVVGEVLGDDEATRRVAWEQVSHTKWSGPRGDGYRTGEDATQFLQDKIFRPAPEDNIRASGFKLFYDHGRFDPKINGVWDYLASTDIRVIHMVRRNLLLTLVSQEVAERTNRWYQLVEEKDRVSKPLPPFSLDPEFCQEYFDRLVAWREWAGEMFARNDSITVEYEAGLCTNFRATTLKVFQFLDTIPWYVKPGLVKQRDIPASRQVSNFKELRACFRNSAYAEFFETADEIVEAKV